MLFTEAGLAGGGVFIVEPERLEDERGFFARAWCEREFRAFGLVPRIVQCNISFNRCRGTLRGMHYQVAPHEEAKLVRCTRGRIYDVVIDLRPDSQSFCGWVGVELTADNHRMLYVPPGCAHGFLTRSDETEVFYQHSEFHNPASARGVRWDDPAFGVVWPEPVTTITPRDASYPDFAH